MIKKNIKAEEEKEAKVSNTISTKSNRKPRTIKILIVLVIIAIVLVAALIGFRLIRNNTKDKTSTLTDRSSQTSIPTVLETSASAITSPPPSMEGINTHTEVYGSGPDPNIITLGPKYGKYPDKIPYPNMMGMVFELNHRAPILAPIDMTLVGFQNNSSEYGIGADGQKYTPMNNLMLFFESASPDWPGMVIVMYHLYSSPLLLGHYQNPDCGDIEMDSGNIQAQGHLFFYNSDYTTSAKGNASTCEALIGFIVKRGELIGFAGNVGTHSFAAFCFKVSDISINPTVQKGNRNLHWVQPSSFFYWKSYSPGANFPSGVLAYPFESDGYQLSAEQQDVNYKYNSKK